MSANLLRLVMYFSGAAAAVALFLLLPFSTVVNGAIALAFWIVESVLAEWLYNRRASLAEKTADLRDRVDNPPS